MTLVRGRAFNSGMAAAFHVTNHRTYGSPFTMRDCDEFEESEATSCDPEYPQQS